MGVLVVIVNYGTPGLTIDCLESLGPEVAKQPGTRVVVADNCSPDNSVAMIRSYIALAGIGWWCTFLALPRNGGFAYGNNQAIKAEGGSAEWVWLLNPDTLAFDGALTSLVQFMQANPCAGIVGGRAENRDGTVRRSCFRFPSPLGELEGVLRSRPASALLQRYVIAPSIPDVPTRVDWVSGASMMVRRSVLDEIGFLDDSYFMYFEETDFCLRAARAGFECWYLPASRIIHLVGQSSGVTGTASRGKRRPAYWFESRSRYFRKNHGAMTTHAANLLWLIGYAVGWALQSLRGKQRGDPPMLWWDFLRYNYGRGR